MPGARIATKKISRAALAAKVSRRQVAFICTLETRGPPCILTIADKRNSNTWEAETRVIHVHADVDGYRLRWR